MSKVLIGDVGTVGDLTSLPLSYPVRVSSATYYARATYTSRTWGDVSAGLALQANLLGDDIGSPSVKISLQSHTYATFAVEPQVFLSVANARFGLGIFGEFAAPLGTSRRLEALPNVPVPTAEQVRWRDFNVGPSGSAAIDLGGVSIVGRVQYRALDLYQGRLGVDVTDASSGRVRATLATATLGVSVPILDRAGRAGS